MTDRAEALGERSRWEFLFHRAVIVGALGYFVDIYDLVLFSIVRVASLKDLGVEGEQLLDVGVHLLNMQMIGMLVGGVLWGILGDKLGRLPVLFGSILVYSLANIANAFVHSVEAYAALRLVAGLGLAGEMGAAITLVSEALPASTRGLGTSVVAGFGVSGAMLAALVGALCPWQVAFVIGGVLGLALLAVRLKMHESATFAATRRSGARMGDVRLILRSWPRLATYLRCICTGIATWFVVGILVTFAPEIGKALAATEPLSAGNAVLYMYFGLVIGDIGSGVLSNRWRSRKKAVAVFLLAAFALSLLFLASSGHSAAYYYVLYTLLGVASGYWALFVTIAAEQFGTNLRSTVAVTVPNFVRGAVVPLTLAFRFLTPSLGVVLSCVAVGTGCFVLAFLGLWQLGETFGRDLDFTE